MRRRVNNQTVDRVVLDSGQPLPKERILFSHEEKLGGGLPVLVCWVVSDHWGEWFDYDPQEKAR